MLYAHIHMSKYTRQIRASFNQYLDYLPVLFHKRKVYANTFTVSGEKWCELQFVGCKIKEPTMLEADGNVHGITPRECRDRNLSYSAPMYVDVHVHGSNRESSVLPDVYMGKLPVMLGCRVDPHPPECPYDPLGYFIINGGEKAIGCQKAHAHNAMRVMHKVVSGVDHWAIACKSQRDTVVLVTTIKLKDDLLCVSFPKLKSEVGFVSLLYMLGIGPDDLRSVLTAGEWDFVSPSVSVMDPRLDLKDTYNLGDSETSRYRDVLKSSLLPHVKECEKGLYLILMLKRLYASIQSHEWTDKDSLKNQRIEMPFDLMVSITQHLLVKLCNDLRSRVHRLLRKNKNPLSDTTISKLISRSTSLTDGLQYCLATGIWNTQFVDKRIRMGVAQVLQRGSVFSAVSQLRRISSSIQPDQKLTKPRELHGTYWGRICPMETPEGGPCGLETQLSTMAHVSIHSQRRLQRG